MTSPLSPPASSGWSAAAPEHKGLQPGDLGLQPGDLGLQPGDLGLQSGDLGLQDGCLGLHPLAGILAVAILTPPLTLAWSGWWAEAPG